MSVLALTGTGAVTTGALMVLWGLGYGAVPVTLQSWILDAAPRPPRPHRRCTSPRSTCPSRSARSSAGRPSNPPAPLVCCGSGPSSPFSPSRWSCAALPPGVAAGRAGEEPKASGTPSGLDRS
ncbi:hypothetical protein ACFQ60_05255 [Streptomyces zhihengii]